MRLRTRRARGKDSRVGDSAPAPFTAPVAPERRLLLRDGDGELPAPLAAATSQDLAPGLGLHALAEPMGSLATLAMGLECPLHGEKTSERYLRRFGAREHSPPTS